MFDSIVGLFYMYPMDSSIHLLKDPSDGPNNGQGTRIYRDGIQTASSNVISSYTFQPGSGRVVIGRLSIDDDDNYADVNLDELLFFNETLSDQNIRYLSN